MESTVMIPLQLMITAVSEVPTDCDAIVSMSGPAVMAECDGEIKISTCLLETEHQIVTAEEALRAVKIVISAVTCMFMVRNYMSIYLLVGWHAKTTFKLHEANEHNRLLNEDEVTCMLF
jgi:hypothetical protein